jgi:general secretion pathway protein G
MLFFQVGFSGRRGISRFENRQSKIGNRKSVGSSLLEMIITLSIVCVLGVAAVPLVQNLVRGRKEGELRQALREIRLAIDRYKEFNDATGGQLIPIELRTQSGYPKKLEILYEGFVPVNKVDGKKVYFLRKLPVDPMTGEKEWKIRSSTDDPESPSSNDEDVFDVHSSSKEKALDETSYDEW